MHKHMRFISLWMMVLILGTSCTKEEPEGSLRLGIQLTGGEALKSAVADRNVTAALVTIAEENGNLLYDHEYLPLYSFGEGYTTRSLKLPAGNFTIEEFMLVDSTGMVQWATPRSGSMLARFVEQPLPVAFAIRSEQTTTLQMQVIRTADQQPSDFGYATFQIDFIDRFCLQVFYSTRCVETWNDSILGPDGSGAPIYLPMLSVWNRNRMVLHEPLQPGLNRYLLPLLGEAYTLEVTDCAGQVVYTESFSLGQLLQHACAEGYPPLVIYRDSIPDLLITPEGLTEPTILQGVFGKITSEPDSLMIQDSTLLPPLVRELYFFPYAVVDSLYVMAPIDCHFPYEYIRESPLAVVRSNSAGFYQVTLEAGTYLYLVKDGDQFFWDAYVSSHRPGHVEVFRDSVTVRNIHIIDCSMWMRVAD